VSSLSNWFNGDGAVKRSSCWQQLLRSTAQPADDTSRFTKCQLGVYEHTEATYYDNRRPDGVTSNWHVEINAGELMTTTTTSAEPDDDCRLSVVQSQSAWRTPVHDGRNAPLHRLLDLVCFSNWGRCKQLLDVSEDVILHMMCIKTIAASSE